MNQHLSKRATTALRISPETTHLRRRVARADQLFSEGLARLQAEYKERITAAALGERDQPEETETAPEPVAIESEQVS